MNTKYKFLVGAILVILGIIFFLSPVILNNNGNDVKLLDKKITNFEECIVAGNPAVESYPRQCRTADGQHFVEDISVDDSNVNKGDQVFCITQYDPVCGEIDVQCIKAPCPPVQQTYSNFCFAGLAGARIIYQD